MKSTVTEKSPAPDPLECEADEEKDDEVADTPVEKRWSHVKSDGQSSVMVTLEERRRRMEEVAQTVDVLDQNCLSVKSQVARTARITDALAAKADMLDSRVAKLEDTDASARATLEAALAESKAQVIALREAIAASQALCAALHSRAQQEPQLKGDLATLGETPRTALPGSARSLAARHGAAFKIQGLEEQSTSALPSKSGVQLDSQRVARHLRRRAQGAGKHESKRQATVDGSTDGESGSGPGTGRVPLPRRGSF